MTRRTYTLIVGILLLVGLGVAATRLPTQYAAMGPGVTFNTLGNNQNGTPIITITGTQTHQTTGNLNMTTVSEYDKMDLLSAIRGWLSASQAVVPREELFPPNQTSQQIQQQNTQQFVSSQNSATIAALAYLGYGHVYVSSINDGSSAQGVLKAGDQLVALNGVKVTTQPEVMAVMTKVKAGSTIPVEYKRDGKTATANLKTQAVQGRDGSAIGVDITIDTDAPFQVKIDLPDIGGPSAGLMFALGILDMVGPDNLTGGTFIAGTGTIDAFGNVGPIGGIPLKMLGAVRAGATVFLSPASNCAEAKAHKPSGLQLIKVTTLNDAVQALETLRSGGTPPTC